ncbi:GatB/YqeY domain-containing protein [Flavobacteriaceae bacterium]|jgi:uncharacterized protein YqeY|nr:GatB/YqeY domain-containing protein [Flavobacteriaceae bacterium]
MGILSKLTDEIKNAMRAKDSLRLDALRAIKSGILLSQTAGTGTKELNDDESIRLLQRLVKQRKESAAIYREQDRADLAEPEEAQAKVITEFLPSQLSEKEVEKIILEIITKTKAHNMKDMGKVMGMASGQLAGRADGKLIARLVKQNLGV